MEDELMESTFSTFFQTAFFSFIVLLKYIFTEMFFWLESDFLIALSLSLLMSNIIRYYRIQKARTMKILTQIFYLVYLIGTILLPIYYDEIQMVWWKWVLTMPYVITMFL